MPPQNNRQADSPLGMLSNYLRTQWSERERETGRPMGIQNVAALTALEFLKPPPVFDESGNITPEALEMMVMGSLGQRAPESIRAAKQSIDKLRSTYAHTSELPSLISKQKEYFERPFVKWTKKKELGELKGFVEDWFADPSHKVRYEDLYGKSFGPVNLPQERWLQRPSSSAQKNIFEEVGKRVDKMRETDVEDIFRYVEEMSSHKYAGEFFPPGRVKELLSQPTKPSWVKDIGSDVRGTPYTPYYNVWENLPESIKKLGTVEVSTGQIGRRQSIPIHEFTHMAEGGWYGQNLHYFTKKHMKPQFKRPSTYTSEGKRTGRGMTQHEFYISKPAEVLARVMELRYEWLTRYRHGQPSQQPGKAAMFKPVGDDFIKFFKDRRNSTYLTLREMYSEKNLKHIVNKLPSIAAVTAAQELIGQQGNATSK